MDDHQNDGHISCCIVGQDPKDIACTLISIRNQTLPT